VPPTNESQLPADYKTRYGAHLTAANATFNAVKTWIEYVNRLAGVLTGLFIAATTLLAFLAFRLSPPFWLSLAGMLLTGAQGFLGAKVVSTSLAPTIISVHMLLAQLIVLLLVAGYWISKGYSFSNLAERRGLWLMGIFASIALQIYMGIHVRQQVDSGINQLQMSKEAVVLGFDWVFYIHRSFSLIVVLAIAAEASKYIKLTLNTSDPAKTLWISTILVVLAETVFGTLLFYFELPAFAQPVHLLLGSMLLGLVFSLFFTSYARIATISNID
jgi:cytochrome c oxidase assembly protein subunit 15